MANTQNISFDAPTDYNTETLAIERRRKLAEALQAQSLQTQPTEVVGGWAVPQGQGAVFNKLLQSISGAYGQSRSDEEQKALATKYQSDLINTVTQSERARLGTPARTIAPDPQEAQQSADQGTPAVSPANVPAVPPNIQLANALLMQHPATQGMGLQGMQRDMQMQQFMNMGGPQAAAPSPNPMTPGPGASVMAGAPGTTLAPAQVPQAPAQAPAGFGGPAGGVPMAVWLQSDPTGGKYIEQLAKDHAEGQKPIVNRGYGVGTMANGKYVPDPASLDQALAMERGKQGIQSQYETVPVTNASGATVPTFKPNIPGYPGGATMPPQPAPQMAPRPAPAAAGGNPWATMPRLATPTGVGQSTYQHTLQTQQGETAHKLSDKYGSIADSANQRLALNQQAQGLVDKADTGPMAAQIGDVKNWLVSRVGIPESSFANTPSATIALQKDLLNAATQKAKAQFGSRMTQSEVMLMLSRGSPNVDMTKASIKYLLQSDSAAATYQVQQATDLGKYLSNGGDPMRFEGWYSKTFPLSQSLGAVHFDAQAQGNTSKNVSWDSLK